MIPYEKCTANKIFHVKQCNIQWYVNDNKITYVSEDVITGVIDTMRKVFGELVVSRGDKHTFIDMDIELVNDEKKDWHVKLYKVSNQNFLRRRIKGGHITSNK